MSPRNPVIPAVLAVAAVALFAVLLVTGADAAAAAVVTVALLVVATGLAVVGWRAAHDSERRLGAVADALRKERTDDRERLERHVRRLEESLSQERVVLRRLRDSWHAQREWSNELRRQLQQFHDRSSGRGDVLELVLDATIRLVNAEKGLLLARADDNEDGDLDLVTATGFSHDPEHSSVVQRFAREVLAQDQIVREDDPARPGDETSGADEEIDGLVAIPLFLHDRFHGVIVCANRPGGFADLEDEVLLALGNHAGVALQHRQLNRELREAHRVPVRVLAEAVSARDPLLHRESVALSVLASGLAGDLGLRRERARRAGDRDAVARRRIPTALGSPASQPRTAHARRARSDLAAPAPRLRDPPAGAIPQGFRDGRALPPRALRRPGLPGRLQGTDIPLAARALSVLEAYGAMTHDRPHRAARGAEEACRELIEHAGTQFDPEIAQLVVERVRHAPARPSDELIDVILENLPLDRRDTDDAALDALRASTVDGLTLLDDQRALQRAVREAASEATAAQRFAVVLLELRDLPRINESLGYPAGDRLIQVAARRALTAATRLGATAYRASGRRLAMHLPLREGDDLGDVLEDIRSEFMAGPAVEVVASAWKPGDRGEDLLARTRRALKGAPA